MALRLPPAPVLLLAIVVPLLSMVPTWQGYLAESPPDRVFLGFRYMAGDHFQYAAFIRQAEKDGTFLMKNLFTSEPQRGVFVFLYFWVLGVVAGTTGLSLTVVWEVFRLLGGFLYVLLFWALTAHFFKDRGRRIFATLLFSLAGGFDWIVTLLRATLVPGIKPLEYPFDYFWNWFTLGTMVVPNWVWPACLITTLCLVLLRRRPGWPAIAFILPPVVWMVHHHSALVLYLALGLLPAMPLIVAGLRLESPSWTRVRENFRVALPGLLSFAAVMLYLSWARSDSVFALNAAKSLEWKVHFSVWWYPLSFGLLLPLTWFGIGVATRQGGPAWDLLLSWLAAAFTLAVNPILGGAKYQYLMVAPIAILAAAGRYHLQEASPRVGRLLRNRMAVAGLALLLFLNAPISIIKDARATAKASDIFLAADEIEAMKWLEGQPDGIVLSSYNSGHVLPWLSGKTVYIGHWFMTLELNEKTRQVAYFFAPQAPPAVKMQILQVSQARYVYFGPSEAAMGSLDPSLPLRKAYEKGRVAIYLVERPS